MTRLPSPPQTVLVVDDEILVRMVAADCLREAGFDVVEADDAREALEVIQARDDISAVFSDINMPGPVDGLDLACQLRDAQPGIAVLLTSGVARPSGVDLHGAAFLPKPYSPETVTRTIRALLAA